MPKAKAQALIDDAPYCAVCGSSRHRGNLASVRAWSEERVREWQALGMPHAAQIFYRDGSHVAEVSHAEA